MIETSEIGKVAQGGGVNSPASGTYGEKADLSRLQQQLPAPTPGGTAGPATPSLPSVSQTPVRPQSPAAPGASAPPGVPAALLAPTNRPYEPVTTPPPGGMVPGAVSADQRRIQTLSMLAENPNVSDSTREWAGLLLRALLS